MGAGGIVGVGVVRPLAAVAYEAPEFVRIESLHGATLQNGAPFLGGTTGFSGGVFTLDYTGDATLINGYRELPGWSIPLLSLHPDYDPERHVLDVLLEILSMGADGSKRGFGFVLADQETLATADGISSVIFDTSVSNRASVLLGATASSGAVINGGLTLNALRQSIEFSSVFPQSIVQQRKASAWSDAYEGSGADMGSLDPTNWHLAAVGYQGPSGTIPSTPVVVTGQISTRLLERGPLP